MANKTVPGVLLPLTRGYVTIVDPDVAEWAAQFKWYAQGTGFLIYARRDLRLPESGSIYLHRQIMEAPRDLDVDHINGNTMDNRRCNLRLADRSMNGHNRRNLPPKAVFPSKDGDGWFATFTVRSQSHRIGPFPSKRDAQAAREAKISELLLAT